MEERTEFEVAWRVQQPKLKRMLQAKRVPDALIDDVLQETALKLYRTWEKVDPVLPLEPLARTIANNCLVDAYRARRAIPVEEVPETALAYDLEDHALARARLGKVSEACPPSETVTG